MKLFIATLAATLTTSLAAVTVQSYTYSNSPSSSYPDSGGMELIDGTDNVPTWGSGVTITSSQIGPFVGWLNQNATITFDFVSSQTVGSVTVWAADSDGAAGVGLPTSITVSDPNSSFSETFSIDNPVGNGVMRPLTLTGFAVTTDQLSVSFTRGQSWTMLSEVTFDSIPEPSSALLLSLTTLSICLNRRRKS